MGKMTKSELEEILDAAAREVKSWPAWMQRPEHRYDPDRQKQFARLQYEPEHKKIDCLHCEKSFKTSENMFKHLESGKCRPGPVRCLHCSRRFKTQDQMYKHLETHPMSERCAPY